MLIIELAFNEYVFNSYFEQLFYSIFIILYTTINEHIFCGKRIRFKKELNENCKTTQKCHGEKVQINPCT